MKWKNKGHEFDEVAKEILDENSEYYLWGAGAYGMNFYNEFKNKINIIGIVDTNKKGQIIDGIEINSPDIIEKKDNLKVILTCSWKSQIYPILEEKGFVKYKDFFDYIIFTSIFNMYLNKVLSLMQLTCPITEKCTLRCKKCVALVPYIKKPINFEKDKIMKNLESTFKIVDEVKILTLSGGDVIIHPNLNEIIQSIGDKYLGKQIKTIEILTNAIVMPTEDTLEILKKYSIVVRISNYGEQTKCRQKPEQLTELLNNNKIESYTMVYDTWIDFGYPQESNNVKNLVDFFDNCGNSNCVAIYDQKIFNCGYSIGAQQVGYCEYDEYDYFDLTKNVNKMELMEFVLGYSKKGYLEYCKKCNGFFNVNKKEVIAGEQL